MQNQQIVNIRGIAILLVMLGHSVIIYDGTFDLLSSETQMPLFETLKHWISFVQMKLFISISGFLLAYKCLCSNGIGRGGGKFVKDKILRLLLPYISILLLYNNPLKCLLGIPGYENPIVFMGEQMLGMNCAHLWYLPCLFMLMMICYPIFVWAGKSTWKHVLIFVCFLVANYVSGRFPKYYQLNEVSYYLVFFHTGYLVNYVRLLFPKQLDAFDTVAHNIILLIVVVGLGYAIQQFTSIGYEVYLSIVVILLFYKFVPSFNIAVINEISKRSYGLYLFHSPLIYITAILCPNINPWLMLFINFVCFGTIAYALTVLISRSRIKFVIGL